MVWVIFAFAGLERCDLPRTALSRTAGDQPGRFVVGPDEKNGIAGRIGGLGCAVIASSQSHVATRWEVTAHHMDRKNAKRCQQATKPPTDIFYHKLINCFYLIILFCLLNAQN
jgi:hypothetical protein